jgi:hypothetical protein
MNDALRTDAFAFAVETEVEYLLLRMLSAALFGRHAA